MKQKHYLWLVEFETKTAAQILWLHVFNKNVDIKFSAQCVFLESGTIIVEWIENQIILKFLGVIKLIVVV